MTLKASPLNSRGSERPTDERSMCECTLKECPNQLLGDSFRVDNGCIYRHPWVRLRRTHGY